MKRFLVWTYYLSDNWKYEEVKTFEDAVKMRERQMSYGNPEVLITELVPILCTDGREVNDGKR